MAKYIFKRLLQSCVTIFLVVTIVFLLLHLMPTDYYFTEDEQMKLSEEQKHDRLEAAGLLDPPLTQLFHFYQKLFTEFDLGVSRRIQVNQPVTAVIGAKFGISMRMGLIALGISLVIGVVLGVLQARYKDGILDHIGTAYTVFVNAVPGLVTYSLILAFGARLFGLPSMYSARKPGPSSILPIVCLAIGSTAGYMLWTRRYMVDELNKDYIRLAKLKGLSTRSVMYRHVLKNAFVPLAQYLPYSILLTVGGSLLVERFFSVPGMGPLLTDAIGRYDINIVLGVVMLYATLGILGLFLGDMLMTLIDPRIRLTNKGGDSLMEPMDLDLVESTATDMVTPVVDPEAPKPHLDIDRSAVDVNADKKYNRGRVHVHSRAMMPERQLFSYAAYEAQAAERTGYSEYSYWKSVWRNFLKKKAAVVMSLIFLTLFLFTFVAGAIGKYDVNNLRIESSLMFIAPNSEFWFGTDNLGRDYWAQVWAATRTSIILAVSVASGQIVVGVLIGLVWGYVRKLDRFFTELYSLIDNIPTIIYMTLIALMIGQSTFIMGAAMIGFGWLGTARNVRNLVFMYRDREYNLASRCLGTNLWRILIKNILPYLISVIILRLALAIPGTIAYETTLTYLGLMDIATPSLGILLRNARSFFLDYPYLLVFPAAIVSIITITFYLVGNAFSDACDPRNHV